MAENTASNPEVTDEVTQANLNVLGQSPAMAMGALYQQLGNATAMAAANAVYAQQQANVTYQAATTVAVQLIINSGRAAHGLGGVEMPDAPPPAAAPKAG